MHVSDQYDKYFVGQIYNISNIFDLMALCISFLLKKTGRDGLELSVFHVVICIVMESP